MLNVRKGRKWMRTRRTSEIVRSMKNNFICEAKGHANIVCSGARCKAHIITRQFREIKNEEHNFIYVCKAHETYFNSEQGKQEWPHFIRVNFPEKYNFVCSKYEFILNEYIQFLKLNVYIPAAAVPVRATEVKVTEDKPKAEPKPLCTHSCHSNYETSLAYCWDCHENHSAWKGL